MPLIKRQTQGTSESITKALQQESPTVEQLAQVATVKNTIAKANKATTSDTMSKADWAAKDVRISRQGLFQAALQSVGILQLNTGNTLEDYMKLVEQVAERGLQFVNKA